MVDNMRALWSKSDAFFTKYMTGAYMGRRLNVWDLMRNYFEQFRSLATNLFYYEGIEPELARQIEKRMFYFGRCGLVMYKDKLTAVNASPYGEDIYNEPIGFNFCFGAGIPDNDSKTPDYRELGRDGVLGRNTFSFYPSSLLVEQYALMMAHCDMSIIAELVNGRFMDVLKAHSNADAESAGAFCRSLYDGKLDFITDKTEDLEIDRSPRAVSHLRELIDTKDRILRDFYNILGINKTAEKRERMITEEAEANTKMLNFNLKDMLDSRITMCEEIASTFKITCRVKSHIDMDDNGKAESEKEFKEGGKGDGTGNA